MKKAAWQKKSICADFLLVKKGLKGYKRGVGTGAG
jgi:hypothetical protein